MIMSNGMLNINWLKCFFSLRHRLHIINIGYHQFMYIVRVEFYTWNNVVVFLNPIDGSLFCKEICHNMPVSYRNFNMESRTFRWNFSYQWITSNEQWTCHSSHPGSEYMKPKLFTSIKYLKSRNCQIYLSRLNRVWPHRV